MRTVQWCLIMGVMVCIQSNYAAAQDDASKATIKTEEPRNLLKATNKVESWRFEQHEDGKGMIAVDGDTIVFEVTHRGSENWYVQAFMTDLTLKEGQEYTLSFEAHSPTPRGLLVVGMIDTDDWHEIGLHEEIFAGKEPRKHEFKFTASGIHATRNRIGFVLGDETGKLVVKGMKLVANAKNKK